MYCIDCGNKDSDFEPKIEKEKQVKNSFFCLEVGLEFGLKAFLAAETAESKENNLSIPYVDILEKNTQTFDRVLKINE